MFKSNVFDIHALEWLGGPMAAAACGRHRRRAGRSTPPPIRCAGMREKTSAFSVYIIVRWRHITQGGRFSHHLFWCAEVHVVRADYGTRGHSVADVALCYCLDTAEIRAPDWASEWKCTYLLFLLASVLDLFIVYVDAHCSVWLHQLARVWCEAIAVANGTCQRCHASPHAQSHRYKKSFKLSHLKFALLFAAFCCFTDSGQCVHMKVLWVRKTAGCWMALITRSTCYSSSPCSPSSTQYPQWCRCKIAYFEYMLQNII